MSRVHWTSVLAGGLLAIASCAAGASDSESISQARVPLGPKTGLQKSAGLEKAFGEGFDYLKDCGERIDAARARQDHRALASLALELALAEKLSGRKSGTIAAADLLMESQEAAERLADSDFLKRLATLWKSEGLGLSDPARSRRAVEAAVVASSTRKLAQASPRRGSCPCALTIENKSGESVTVAVQCTDGTLAIAMNEKDGSSTRVEPNHCPTNATWTVRSINGIWKGSHDVTCEKGVTVNINP